MVVTQTETPPSQCYIARIDNLFTGITTISRELLELLDGSR